MEVDNKYEILNCNILAQTKAANDFSVEIADNRKVIVVNFDYLDYNDGVVLRVRHTGENGQDLVMKGSVKAVKAIQRKGVPMVRGWMSRVSFQA